MTAAIFSRMTPIDNTEICPTCRSSVEEEPTQEWYGHSVSGGPVIHYAHRECLLELLKNGLSTCPGMCGQRINPDSLVSWKDRVKPFFVNAAKAAGVAGVLGETTVRAAVVARGTIGMRAGVTVVVIVAVGLTALMLMAIKNRNSCGIIAIFCILFGLINDQIGIKFPDDLLGSFSLLIVFPVLSGLITAAGIEIFRPRGAHG